MLKTNDLSLRFAGDFVVDNKISLRTYAKALESLQNAINRAYLDDKYNGKLHKHAKLPSADYPYTEFLVLDSLPGSFFVGFKPLVMEYGEKIKERLVQAIQPAFNKAINDGQRIHGQILEQIETRKLQLHNQIALPKQYEDVVEKYSDGKKFGDRSIVKEVDIMTQIVRHQSAKESTIELTIVQGNKTNRYEFDRETSRSFHKVVSDRTLGEQFHYAGRVISLDWRNLKGKIESQRNGKTITISFGSLEDIQKAGPFGGKHETMYFVGCPVIEYGTFDPEAGDIYFIDLDKEDRGNR